MAACSYSTIGLKAKRILCCILRNLERCQKVLNLCRLIDGTQNNAVHRCMVQVLDGESFACVCIHDSLFGVLYSNVSTYTRMSPQPVGQ